MNTCSTTLGIIGVEGSSSKGDIGMYNAEDFALLLADYAMDIKLPKHRYTRYGMSELEITSYALFAVNELYKYVGTNPDDEIDILAALGEYAITMDKYSRRNIRSQGMFQILRDVARDIYEIVYAAC